MNMIKCLGVFSLLSICMTMDLVGMADCGDDLQVLTVGLTSGKAPFATAVGNTLQGFDIDLACQLQKRLGFDKLVFKDVPFSEVTNGPVDADFTLTMGGITVTPARLATANWVIYFPAGTSVIYNTANPPSNVTPQGILAALNAAPTAFAVLSGSREQLIFSQGTAYPGIKAALFSRATTQDIAVAFLAGSLSAAIVDNDVAPVVVEQTATLDPSRKLAVVPYVFIDYAGVESLRPVGTIGIGVNKACCQLLVNVHQAVVDMIADRTIATLTKKWVPTIQPVTSTNSIPASCSDFSPMLPKRCSIGNFICSQPMACTFKVMNLNN